MTDPRAMSRAHRRAHDDRECPACEQRSYCPLTMVRGTQIVQCTACGLATWNWQGFDPETFYDASYWRSHDPHKGYADYFALAAATQRTHTARLRWIRKAPSVATRPIRLLDAGCGPGFFVQAAARSGFTAAGVELSQAAVSHARDELGQNVWQGRVEPADLHDGPYDVVTLWDVIEHLPDPAASLAALSGVLNPGGLLAVSTGDVTSLTARLSGARWHLFTLPEHLWFHTPNSLRRLLRRAGLHPIDCRYEVCWYTVRYLAERLEAMFGSRGWISSRLGAIGRRVVPATLADVVTVLARKPRRLRQRPV